MKHSLSGIFGMLITFFLIRILSFAAAIPNNFDNLWRPSGFSSFPQALIAGLFILGIYVFYRFTKELSHTDNAIKTSYFAYMGVSYIIISLFNRTILNFPFSYLFLMQNMKIGFSEIIPSIVLDMFFEPPYSFWALGFMGIVFYLCKKHNHIEYAIPFWILPIAFVFCAANTPIITMHFCGCLIALLGLKHSKGNSSIIIVVIQFLIATGLCLYLNQSYYNATPFLGTALVTIALIFIPAFLLIYKCIKSSNKSAIAATWLLPGLIGFFMVTPLLRLPSQYNLVSLIATLNCMLFAGNIAIVAAIIVLLSALFSKLLPGSGKLCSRLLFACAIAFYLVDGILFYYSQMRPDYQTLSWTLTMNDIGKTTVATCAEYFTPTSGIIIILCLLLTIFTAAKGYKATLKVPGLTTSILILIAVAQFSSMLMPSSTIPQAMRDPFLEMLKSIPTPEFLAPTMSMNEIRKGLEECRIPLQEYSDSEAKPGNRTNVVLITLESLHWRYMNMFGNATQTFPLLSKLKDRMEIFPFMFSCYPESTCGDYSLISGLVPHDHVFLSSSNNVIHKTLVNELKKAGYNTSMFSSESVNDGNLINITKTQPFDYFFHYNSSDTEYKQHTWNWGYKEEFTASKIIEYLQKQSAEQPHFVWYRTVYPHAPFPVFDKKDSLVFRNPDKKPGEIDFVTNYKNSLIYLDRVLSNFVAEIDALDKKNNQKTIIFMVGDHGEMLGEPDNHNQNGHGIYISPQLTAVTAIMIKPTNEGLKVNQNICSQIDVLPTILDYLSLEPAITRFGQGNSLLRPINISRPVYLASVSAYALSENGYYFEFPDKENHNTKIYKLALTDDFKPAFIPVEKWDEADLQSKFDKTSKFYKLQQQLLKKSFYELANKGTLK